MQMISSIQNVNTSVAVVEEYNWLSAEGYTQLPPIQRERKYVECFFIFQSCLKIPKNEESITTIEQEANNQALRILTELLPRNTVEKAQQLVHYLMTSLKSSEQKIKLEPELFLESP